jgi:serine phosphatase RsbU (regulator of sigma subunit)
MRWRNIIYLIILGFVLGSGQPVSALTPVEPLKTGTENKMQGSMEVFVSQRNNGSTANPQALPIEKRMPTGSSNLGFFDGELWVRFRVCGSADNDRWMLELAYPFYNKVEIFEERKGKPKKVFSGGDHIPFKERIIQHRNFLFPFQAGPNDTVNFYIHIVSNGEATALPVSIWDRETFIKTSNNQQPALGIYYGIILFALILSVFMVVLLRERTQYYYLGYLVGIGLFQFSLDGFGFQYLWSSYPAIANHIIPFSGSMAAAFLLLFSTNLLKTKVHFPSLCRFMLVLAGCLFVIMALSLLDNPFFTLSLKGANLFALLGNLLVFVAGILGYRKKVASSSYFIVAFCLLIVGALLALFKNFGWLPRVFITEYGLQLGSAVEIVLLSLALASNIRLLKSENEKVQAQLLEELKEKFTVQQKAKEELEIKVLERTAEISFQKGLIEQKNKDITDSILYAKRIQEAIGTTEEELNVYFPDSFLLMKPRDIVNGDFFWMGMQDDYIFLAIADCTGHGVPGALMSMIGNTFLNEIVNNYGITDTGEILDLLRVKVIKLLRQYESESKDGMDIALLRISPGNREMQFSGAFNPLVVISKQANESLQDFKCLLKNGETSLYQIPANRFPVGIVSGVEHENFLSYNWHLSAGDSVYLYSDGYADQFGGSNGKKLKLSKFYELLLLGHDDKMQLQKDYLHNHFEQWKGEEEQVDDVSILGLRF